MDTQRLAGLLVIAGFVAVVVAWPVSVPGFYQTEGVSERVRLVQQHRVRWNVSRILLYLWSFLSTAVIGVLAIYLRRNGAHLVATLGALSFALGSVAYFLVNYSQHADLAGYLTGKSPDYHAYGNWLVLVGLLLLGLAFSQAGVETWLSSLTMVAAVLPAVVLLVWPAWFWLIPFLPLLPLLLVIGIVLLRQ